MAGELEWTFEEARSCWTPMWRPTQHVGVPGYGWQPMVLWDGSILLGPSQYATSGPAAKAEAESMLGPIGEYQHHLCFAYGSPMRFADRTGRKSTQIRRELDGGRLPIPHIETRDGGLVWHEVVFAHLIHRGPSEGMDPKPGDNLIVHALFNVRNNSPERREAHLWVYLSDTHTSSFAYESTVSAGLGEAVAHRFEAPYGRIGDRIRYVVPPPARGAVRWHDEAPVVTALADPSADDAASSGMVGAKLLAVPPSDTAANVLEWEVSLEPGEEAHFAVLVPLGPVDQAAAASILALDSPRELAGTRRFWRDLQSKGARIITPEPLVNDYLAAARGQMAQHVAYRRLAGQWHFKTSPNVNEFYWPCNGAMGLPTLDMCGLSGLTRPVLRTLIETQTDNPVGLPADRRHGEQGKLGEVGQMGGEGFETRFGFLGYVGEWTAASYLLSHGVCMWALAQHYRITRDAEWLGSGPGSPMQAMLDAVDWVLAQRKRTMREIDGRPVDHWGLLPAASAHDWFSGNTIFNDAWCIFGMIEVARLLEETGHPRRAAIAAELEAYKNDLRSRYVDAREKARKLPLPDGSEIPYIPRDVYELDWSKIDWTYTGYGPLRAGAVGAFDPHDELVDQALAFLEAGMPRGEGPYIHMRPVSADENWRDVSDPAAPRHWIWRNYVEYETMWPIGYHLFLARDDLPRFFEWLFCNLAAAIHHDWLVGVEALDGTPSNAPGEGERWRAVRNMFVNERGGYDGSRQSLWLLQAIPRSWLMPGCRMSAEDVPTCFGGTASVDLSVADDGSSVRATVALSQLAVEPRQLVLRLRSGDGRSLKSAAINGEPARVLAGDLVQLPAVRSGRFEVTGSF